MNRLSLSALTALCIATPSMAVVVSETVTGLGTTSASYVGQLGTLGGAVLIGPDVVITTRHQVEGTGSPFVLNGSNYTVGQQLDSFSSNIDLRVFRITQTDGGPVALSSYAPLYSGSAAGQRATVIGYGGTAGSSNATGFAVNTYNPINAGPRLQGFNVLDATGTLNFPAPNDAFNGNPVYAADFDGPTGVGSLGTGRTAGESTVAPGDSGGGWFVQVGSQWQLAGLTFGVEDPSVAVYGEQILITRLQTFVPAIQTLVPEPASMGLLLGGAMLLTRQARRR